MFTILKRKVIIALTAISSLIYITSCKNKPDYQTERKQVLDLHDRVMTDGGKAENKEMLFDSLLKSGLKQLKLKRPALDTTAATTQIAALNKQLGDADEQMENWMHAYNNDFKGKTDQETMNYFIAEKGKISKVDSLYKEALRSADIYLKDLKIKPDTSAHMDSKMKM